MGVALLLEAFNKRIRGEEALAHVLGYRPLVVFIFYKPSRKEWGINDGKCGQYSQHFGPDQSHSIAYLLMHVECGVCAIFKEMT